MNAPDPRSTALLLIDVINDFEFEGSGELMRHALPAAMEIARLKRRMREVGIPAIYVNDNFGRWQSDFQEQIRRCLEQNCPGHPFVNRLVPDREDYFVLKPKHSGFYSTSLEVLLAHLGVRTLILTGIAGDICVLYTANDAYMRDYRLIVASDGVASETREGNEAALGHMGSRLKACVMTSSQIADLFADGGAKGRLPE